MILKGSQRGGAYDLARHLMKPENEHVELYELRGFVAEDLHGAFQEVRAVARGTQCRQFLFSLSLNPPGHARVDVDAFESAADAAEKRLGLTDQPRAIVFHEKEGRRHAHLVWSRIDAETMTARTMSHYKRKLTALSRELYLEHGWEMPDGLRDPLLKNPLNFTRAEWSQAMRTNRDPREIKQAFQAAWRHSDGKKAFIAAMQERGFLIARGDRRGFVVIDHSGEVYSLPRWAGLKTKEVKERLGDPEALPSLDEAKAVMRKTLSAKFAFFIRETKDRQASERETLTKRKRAITDQHRGERERLKAKQAERAEREALVRADRFRAGLKGALDWLTGKARAIREQNAFEAWEATKRDRDQKDQLIANQLDERRTLQTRIIAQRRAHMRERRELSIAIGEALKLEGRRAIERQRIRAALSAPAHERDGPDLER